MWIEMSETGKSKKRKGKIYPTYRLGCLEPIIQWKYNYVEE